MKNPYFICGVLFALSMSIFFTACNNKEVTAPTDAGLLKAFFDKNAPKSETFTLNATQYFKITTTKGTTIEFPSNGFIDDKGKAVIGDIKVTVKEIQKASEMLLADKPTLTSTGQILVSFGEMKVDVTQNGKTVLLRDTSALRVNMNFISNDQPVPKTMPMWKGDTTIVVTSNGLNSEGMKTIISGTVYPLLKGVSWEETTKSASVVGTNRSVSFVIDKLGHWVNADVLLRDTRPKTTILGYYSKNFNPNITIATAQRYAASNLFFKIKNTQSLVKLYNIILSPTAGKEGFHSNENLMPIGMEGTFLAISMIDGKYYADMKDVIITAPPSDKTFMGITFTPVEVTEAELLTKINSLNNK